VAATAVRARVNLRAKAADAVSHPWRWVVLLVAAAIVAGCIYVSHIATFFVQTDEMTYFKASFDIWQTKWLLSPGDAYFSTWGQLAPLVRAPAFVLGSSTDAFDAAHVINVLAFASSAVPIYLLARPLVRWAPLAVLAAALSVAIPWFAITGTMLAEPMAYPAFCWALLGIQRSVARPGPRADVLAIAGIGLAFFGRTQFAALLPALLLAVVVHELSFPLVRREPLIASLREAVRGHVVLLAVVAVGVLMVLVLGKDRVVGDTLGSYTQTAYGSLIPAGTLRAAIELLAIVGVASGVIPLALAIGYVLRSFVRPDDREAHAFACTAVAVGLVVGVVVGSYVVRFTLGPGMADRYLFYLAPILFVGMLALLGTVRRAPVAIVLGGLAAFFVYRGHSLLENPGSPLSPAAPFHAVINGRIAVMTHSGIEPMTLIAIVALVVALAAAVPRYVISPRVVAAAAGALVLTFTAVETYYTLHNVSKTQAGVPQSYLDTRNWVDKRLPDGATAAAILGEIYDRGSTPLAWWEAIFFNDKVPLPYYDLANADEAWGQTAVQSLKVDERTGAITGLGDARYVIRSTDDRRWPIAGARTITQVGNFLLQEVPKVKRTPWTLRGTDQAGRLTPGQLGTLRVFGTRAPATKLTIVRDAAAKRPAAVHIDDAGASRSVIVRPGATKTITVRPLRRSSRTAPLVRLRAAGRRSDPGVQVTGVELARR
jgi:hypothetical protein